MIEKNKIKWLTIAILILISTPATVGINLELLTSKDISNYISNSTNDSFDENITYYMNQGHMPGLSACIVINNSIVWQKGYGF